MLLRAYAFGQIKKGVRSIEMGGDGADTGNTHYINGNNFGLNAVGVTTPCILARHIAYFDQKLYRLYKDLFCRGVLKLDTSKGIKDAKTFLIVRLFDRWAKRIYLSDLLEKLVVYPAAAPIVALVHGKLL